MARRAANGESSIHQGADGRWHGYVTVGLRPGARADRRHVSAATRAGTVSKVRDLERQRDAGLTATAGPAPTLGEWLEHWLANIAAHRVRRRSLESYRATVRLHLSPGIGRHRLDRLQPEHLEQLYSALLNQGLASATVLRAHRILSRALKVAMQRGRIARNVATLVDPPAARHTDTAQPLSLDEARQVLQAAVSQRNAARWTVALALGLRQSEALALRWSDIDWTAGTLTVRRGVHRVAGGGLVYEEPKSERSRRTLALPAPLVTALRVQRCDQHAEREIASDLWADHQLVFAQTNGRPIDKKVDYHNWTQLLASAGVRHIRLHDGRHTQRPSCLVRRVASAGRHGASRPLPDAHDNRHLLPRHARTRPRSGRQDGGRPAHASRPNCNQNCTGQADK